MFSPDYYSKLDPSYREDLGKLESKLGDPKSFPAQYALLDFIGKHMAPRELYNLVMIDNVFIPEFYRRIVKDRVLLPFFFKECCNFGKRFYDRDDFKELPVLEDLLFPHKNLVDSMEAWERGSYSFLSTYVSHRYKKIKDLYSKIKEVEHDCEEWFDALVESDNLQFVRDNVEHRLGENLTDKALWKKYINYLKEHDVKLLFETYSKYCRFFTDDTEMKKEYHQAALKHDGPVVVPWKNPFEFELEDIEACANKWAKGKEAEAKFQLPQQPLTRQFDASTAAKQKLPFKIDMIEYILDNADGEVLQKLFETCKWFRASLPVNVCYKFQEEEFGFNGRFEFNEQSIISSNNAFLYTNFDQLFITTVFRYLNTNVNRNAVSNLIPMIYRCTAKYVDIFGQNLSLEDLQFLIGRAVELNLSGVRDSDGNLYKLESILQLIPKIKGFRIGPITCSTETSDKLLELQFENKLKYIHFYAIDNDLLDPQKFAEFVKKNCSSTAQIWLRFKFVNGREDYSLRFAQVLDDAINEKWTGNEKPWFSICLF